MQLRAPPAVKVWGTGRIAGYISGLNDVESTDSVVKNVECEICKIF